MQLKEMVARLPPEVLDNENWTTMLTQAENFLKESVEIETPLVSSSMMSQQQNTHDDSNSISSKLQEHRIEENKEAVGVEPSLQDGENVFQENNCSPLSINEASMPSQNPENNSKSQDSSRSDKTDKEGETEVTEPFEPGVYVTLIVKPNGVKIFKRVKFRY